jgi:hypothetical protein
MNTKARRETSLTGVSFAILAAVLFGASTPFAKIFDAYERRLYC